MLLFALFVVVFTGTDYAGLWESFKETHHRVYGCEAEEKARLAIFMENVDKIIELNAQFFPTSVYAVNEFSDLTPSEFRSKYTGYIPSNRMPNYGEIKMVDTSNDDVDWRKEGYVTDVKNQGQCGSCWAFSAVGCMEGAWKGAGNTLVSFSAQQLVDCDKVDQGCNGGLMDYAFEYAISKGMEKDDTYPYKARKEFFCKYKEENVVGHFTKYTDFKDETEMESQCAQTGPISVALDATRLMSYSGGVITGPCGTQLDHGVLAVGFVNSEDTPYWIVKNSWGAKWGEDGFFRIEKGKNECGIAQASSYVTV